MEQDRSKSQNGTEVAGQDWNAVAQLASRSQDFVLAELFRPAPRNISSGAVSRGVIPYAYHGTDGTDPRQTGIVVPTGTNNPTLQIYPFRVVIGPTLEAGAAVRPIDAWRGARTVVIADLVEGLPLAHGLTLAATIANNRCDLVYVKILLDEVTQTDTRYMRDPLTKVLSQADLPVQTDDTFEFGVVSSAEATNPSLPSLPADGSGSSTGNDVYVPLAYCFLQHPTSGIMSKVNILEVAPVIPISGATGAASMQPGNSQWDPAMATLSGAPFTITGHRPDAYVPPTMNGLVSRFFAFQWDHSPKTPAIGTPHVIDDTIDWRNRIFWTHVFAHGGGSEHFAWSLGGGGVPTATPSLSTFGVSQLIGMGQSFKDDDPTSSLVPSPAGFVARLTNTILSNISNPVYVYVNLTDGKLMVSAPVDPTACVFIRIDASGPFTNGAP